MIKYHGTPCGGEREQVARFFAGRHALIPWARPEDIGTVAEVCESFICDNSAYTFWKAGKVMTDWSSYYEWVDSWRKHPGFDWAVIPDVIDGTEADNDAMLRAWMNEFPDSVGVPVWHFHEPLSRLERLAGEWPRVALGSSGQWPTPGTEGWWGRVGDAMDSICDRDGRPKCKLHGLRMLDPAIFHRLPLASADSTNAVRNAASLRRFGIYVPPNNGTRMSIIAERIEAHQSAAVWVPRVEQPFLLMEDLCTK